MKKTDPEFLRFLLLATKNLTETKKIWADMVLQKSKTLPTSSKHVVTAGRKAWHRIKGSSRMRQNYRDWQAVSDALQVGEDMCIELAGGTDRGGRYSRLVGMWLRTNGMFDISPAVRAWCREMRRNQAAIDSWRNSLPTERRAKLNHPRTILEHWHKYKTSQQSNPPESM
jgi:hypothetical protein